MTVAKPLYTTNGIELFEEPDGAVYGYRGSELVGAMWPSKTIPGRWRVVADGSDIQAPSRHLAIRHLVGRCPDCVCDPYLCEHDDSGDSCLDCGFCLNGCSADECP